LANTKARSFEMRLIMLREGSSVVVQPEKAESAVKHPIMRFAQDWLAFFVEATVPPFEEQVREPPHVVLYNLGMQQSVSNPIEHCILAYCA
jgi:hypothetical protein